MDRLRESCEREYEVEDRSGIYSFLDLNGLHQAEVDNIKHMFSRKFSILTKLPPISNGPTAAVKICPGSSMPEMESCVPASVQDVQFGSLPVNQSPQFSTFQASNSMASKDKPDSKPMKNGAPTIPEDLRNGHEPESNLAKNRNGLSTHSRDINQSNVKSESSSTPLAQNQSVPPSKFKPTVLNVNAPTFVPGGGAYTKPATPSQKLGPTHPPAPTVYMTQPASTSTQMPPTTRQIPVLGPTKVSAQAPTVPGRSSGQPIERPPASASASGKAPIVPGAEPTPGRVSVPAPSPVLEPVVAGSPLTTPGQAPAASSPALAPRPGSAASGPTHAPGQATVFSGPTLTPRQAPVVSGPGLTPKQIPVVPRPTLTLGQGPAPQDHALTSKQAPAATGPTVTLKQAPTASSPTVTPKQASATGPTVTPKQASATGPTVTPKQAPVATGPAVTPKQTPAATGPTVTPKQAPAATGPVTPKQAPDTTGPAVTLKQAPAATGPAVTPKQTPAATGPAVTLKQAPAATGPAVTPKQAPAATGPTVTPKQAPAATGPIVTPKQAPVATGPTVTPKQAPVARGPILTPGLTPAPGSGSTLRQTPAAPGSGLVPGQTPVALGPAPCSIPNVWATSNGDAPKKSYASFFQSNSGDKGTQSPKTGSTPVATAAAPSSLQSDRELVNPQQAVQPVINHRELAAIHSTLKSLMTKNTGAFRPVTVPRPRGIRNIGNTCYIAAVLQALLGVDHFVGFVNTLRDNVGECDRDCVDMLVPLSASLIWFLNDYKKNAGRRRNGMKNEDRNLVPLEELYITGHIGLLKNENLKVGYQGDASEFLAAFVQQVQAELKMIREEELTFDEDGKPVNKQMEDVNCPLQKIFGGKLAYNLHSADMSPSSTCLEPFITLPIPIADPSITSLERALSHYFSPEILKDTDNTKYRKVSLSHLPPVWIIIFSTTTMEQGRPKKLQKQLTFTEDLFLEDDWLSNDLKEDQKRTPVYYKLCSGFLHIGEKSSQGHYISFRKNHVEGNWFLQNDEHIGHISDQDLFGCGKDSSTMMPHGLIYRRERMTHSSGRRAATKH